MRALTHTKDPGLVTMNEAGVLLVVARAQRRARFTAEMTAL